MTFVVIWQYIKKIELKWIECSPPESVIFNDCVLQCHSQSRAIHEVWFQMVMTKAHSLSLSVLIVLRFTKVRLSLPHSTGVLKEMILNTNLSQHQFWTIVAKTWRCGFWQTVLGYSKGPQPPGRGPASGCGSFCTELQRNNTFVSKRVLFSFVFGVL